MNKSHPARIETCGKSLRRWRMAGVALLLATSAPALAIDFQNDDGSVTGSLDTTLSFGQAWRVQDPDLDLIATADGGTGRSPNIDDGNLNYRSGDVYSRAVKAITELSVKRGDFGIFVRAQALYDFAVADSDTARTPISDHAKKVAGDYMRFLDAFAYGKWTLGDSGQTFGVRAGKLVLNWGESTFIQGGVNSINPVDVSALRVPGAELREAFLPVEMLHLTWGLSTNITAEAFYQFKWRETKPEPVGTYFSSNDFVPTGGNKVVLGFGAFSDQGVDFRPLGGPFITDFQNVKRGPTIEASDSGQYGLALRFYAPDFSNGTEFGLYFMKYNSRLPLISGRTGTQAGVANSRGTLTAVSAAATALGAGQPAAAAIAIGANAGAGRAAADGGNLSQATAAQYATIAVNMALAGATQAQITAQATNLGTHEYAKTAEYFTEFPDDLKLIGASFNTQVGTSGIALQGELTYKMDVPLQFDDVEVLFAALTPFEAGAFALQGIPLPTSCPSFSATLAACGQLGSYGVNEVIRGWGRYDIWQYQMTGTRSFAQVLWADQLILVAEAGVTHVADMPSKTSGGPNGRGIRFNSPGTSVSGNLELAGKHFGEVEPEDRFPTATSWGYRIGARLEYPGLLGAWNVSPRLAWAHDVSGTTPGPGGNFIDGRHALTVGVGGSLQSTWELDLNYTQFGGASRWNDLNDRDFVAFSAKYSF